LSTPKFAIPEITASQASKYITHNTALRYIEALLKGVVSRTNSGPPASPVSGDAYIVDSATGGWSSFAVGDIAFYSEGAWYKITPVEGVRLYVNDEDVALVYTGSAWNQAPAEKLEYNAVSRLATVTLGLQTVDGAQTIYTVPAGKKMIPAFVIVRNPTASLAGATDVDFGDGANRDTWKTNVDLSAMINTTDCMVVSNDNAIFSPFDAGDTFGINPATGATADADAVFELFGYLYDA
jgi:hypothetical protein